MRYKRTQYSNNINRRNISHITHQTDLHEYINNNHMIQIQSVRQIKLKSDFTETVTETDSHKAKQKHLNYIHILACSHTEPVAINRTGNKQNHTQYFCF